MDISKLYERIGIDFSILLERFCGNKEMLCRFVLSFPDDLNYDRLTKAVEKRNYNEIENYAHALKGVSANLEFDGLKEACSEVVQEVRGDRLEQIPHSFQKVQREYENIRKEIQNLKTAGGLE